VGGRADAGDEGVAGKGKVSREEAETETAVCTGYEDGCLGHCEMCVGRDGLN